MKVTEAVTALHSALAEIEPHLPTLDSVDDQHSLAKAELQATQEQLSKTKEESASAAAEFDKQQATALAQIETARNGKARELKALQLQINEAQSALDDLNSEIRSKTAHHAQIEASLGSLRRLISG